MGFVELLSSGGLSAIFGGISGVIGTIFTGYMSYKTAKLNAQTEIEKKKLDNQMIKDEIILHTERDKVGYAHEESLEELHIVKDSNKQRFELEKGDQKNFKRSMEVGNEKSLSSEVFDIFVNDNTIIGTIAKVLLIPVVWSLGFVDVLKGVTRPAITAFSLGSIMYIIDMLNSEGLLKVFFMNTDKLSDHQFAIISMLFNAIVMIAVTSATWYFGDRMLKKSFLNNIENPNMKKK